MNHFTCPNCDKTSFPSFVLNDHTGKLVAQCPNSECLMIDNRLGPSDFNQGIAAIAVEGASETTGWTGKQELLVTVDTQPQSASQLRPFGAPAIVPPIATGPLAPATSPALAFRAPQEPSDVISMIEQRSLWLGSEEARLEGELAATQSRLAGIRAENKRLSKMLRAAQRTDEPIRDSNGDAVRGPAEGLSRRRRTTPQAQRN